MATVSIYDWNKKEVGKAELNDAVFGQPIRTDLLHTVVRWQLAKRRRGTHKTKTRADVSGGGKKPFKQKGTGNARQGTSRSPLMEGGAILFGPVPRDYNYALPRKVRQAGLKTALSHLLKEGRLYVVDNMDSKEGKTGELVKRLKTFGVEKTVLVDTKENDLFKRAARNIKGVRYYSSQGLNVYDLLKYDAAIVTKDTLAEIETKCGVGN